MEQWQQDQKLAEAMDEYGDYLVKLCYTYVRNWQTAEDLTQDAFIKYYAALPKFRGDASVKTYLFRISINVCHDYLASWKHRKIHVSQLFQIILKDERTPERISVQKDEQQQLVDAIQGLALKYKDVIILFHFAEMSLEEVADALKLPVNTVKTRLRRARQTLGLTLMEGGDLYARSDS